MNRDYFAGGLYLEAWQKAEGLPCDYLCLKLFCIGVEKKIFRSGMQFKLDTI